MALQNATSGTDKAFREVSVEEMLVMLEAQRDHYQEKLNRLSRVMSELMALNGDGVGLVAPALPADGTPVVDGAEVQANGDAPYVRPHMSAAARKRISDAQKRRWAKIRAKKAK